LPKNEFVNNLLLVPSSVDNSASTSSEMTVLSDESNEQQQQRQQTQQASLARPYPSVPERKTRKGPAPKLFGNEACKICESKATGFHYNVLSCEACKNFFRRAVVHGLKYECKSSNHKCSVKVGYRPRCQFCRLAKCKEAGMKTDYINRGRGANRSRKASKVERVAVVGEPYHGIIVTIEGAWSEMEELNAADGTLLNIGKQMNIDKKSAFLFFCQCATMKVRKIVHFCKRLPKWDSLEEVIQINLIKGGLTEAMILFNTLDYDPNKEVVKFMDGKLRSKEAFVASGFGATFVDAIFDIWKFCHHASLVDRTSIALIFAAVLTSPDRQLMSRHKSQYFDQIINELHSSIIDSLRLHLSIRNRNSNSFAKAITLLVNLRQISDGLMPGQLKRISMMGLPMNPLMKEFYGCD